MTTDQRQTEPAELEDWIFVGAKLYDISRGGAYRVTVTRLTPTQIVCSTPSSMEYRYERTRAKTRGSREQLVHRRRGGHSGTSFLGEASHPAVIDQRIRDAVGHAQHAVDQARRMFRNGSPAAPLADDALAYCDAIENAARAARRAVLAALAKVEQQQQEGSTP